MKYLWQTEYYCHYQYYEQQDKKYRYSTLSSSLQILPWAICQISWKLKRQLPHKKVENQFRTSHCKDSSTQRTNRIDGKCTLLSRDLGNQLNLWRSFRTRCSVPNFGISKSAWFKNHLETISKAYVRILGRSTWNPKEYLKNPKICPPSASTSAPTHLKQTTTSPLSTHKTFESTVPTVSWQQKGAVLKCNDQQTSVTITETSNNSGSNKTKKTESNAKHHTIQSADIVMK